MEKLVEFQGLKFLQKDFKISSDNYLFFQFVKFPKKGTAVELGAGFGLGTVILAKKYPNVEIFAVEYQEELFRLLIKILALNKVKNVRPILCDVREIENCFPKQMADVVYSNPPFWKREFLTEKSKKSKVYILANYEVETDYKAFLKAAKYLLKSTKSFYLMMDTPRLVEVLETLKLYKFQPKELQFAYPNKEKPSHVFFVKSILGGKGESLKVLQPVYSTALKQD
jgi:tRNA1(Val) A37 N6-methylase TrmN6